MKKKKRTKKLKIWPVLLVLCLLLVLAAGIEAKLVLDDYYWLAGELIAKDSAFLDLRDKNLTLAEYDEIHNRLPGCEILWSVPFQGRRYPSNTAVLQLTALSPSDVQVLCLYFPKLAVVNAEGCRDYASLAEFHKNRPGCALSYQVVIGNTAYPNDSASITVPNANAAELLSNLQYLPFLEDVELTGTLPEGDALWQVMEKYSEVDFVWQYSFEGKTLSNQLTSMNVSGKKLVYAQASDLLKYMPNLQTIDMRDCGLSASEMMSLIEINPNCKIIWKIEIAGRSFLTDAEEIDLSGAVLGSTEEVERVLPCFPNLKRVIMCGCRFSNETMDALNQKYPDIRFVWSFTVQGHEIRTDATYFYPYKLDKHMFVKDEEIYPLRYCTDMIAIDVGHNSGVTNCEWAAFMPNLKYLIIIETSITDLKPLSGLKNLVFLEIFTTKITDYSPLLGCTGLEDLNLGNTYGDPKPLLQMTWLKNIWWSGIEGSYGLICSDAPQRLREALPNTYMKFNMENPNVGNGWRYLQNYKDMRDVLGMFYLD